MPDVNVSTAFRTFGRETWMRFVTPADLGLSVAVGLDVGVTSNPIDTAGFNQLAIGYDFVHSSATELLFYFQTARLQAGPWRDIPKSTFSGAYADMGDLIFRRAVSGNVSKPIDMPINAAWMRVRIVGTSAHATNDQITMDWMLKTGSG